MALKVDTMTAPAFWACALINADLSGMSNAEVAAMEATLAPLEADGWYVVDVVRNADGEADEPRFSNCYDMYGGDARGGDVLDYVLHKQT